MRYRAFLSYSHVDAQWARWLMRRLESYRVPKRLVGTPGHDGPIPARLGVVFRDRDELPSAGDLSTTIKEALAESAALVVICSQAASQSHWVDSEVRAFLEQGDPDRVFCFIVDGRAGEEPCFPPATIRDGRIPLAADARPDGDGKDRAFLKLVAGLLGVGYDTLVQREAQRRNRRLALVAAASVAGMAITSSLAITAHVARNDAQRRQAQAEDLLGFMLGDLRKKLTTVGRLDLMRTVDDKATTYFAELDPRDLNDAALEEQARSLTGIGEVRLEEGKFDAASKAFNEAYERTSALYERDTTKGQRLFDRAQAEYWIGYVAFRQQKFADAERWLTRYRDSAVQLAAMDPKNFDWQKEMAYGYHNLAALDEARGRNAESEAAMAKELGLFQRWVRERPTDTTTRFEMATVVSFLGSNALAQGRLREAEARFSDLVATVSELRRIEPKNANWRVEYVNAQTLRADALFQLGRVEESRIAIEETNHQTDALVAQDPSNHTWATAQGVARLWRARLTPSTDASVDARFDEAARLLAKAHAAEPDDAQSTYALIRARTLQAQSALDRKEDAAARTHAAQARALIDPAWKASQEESLRIFKSQLALIEGRVAQREGDATAATKQYDEARGLLLQDVGKDGPPFARLDPLVRTYHLLDQDDAAQQYRQRLVAAAYVPFDPLPPLPGVASR